jgi:hypothetical protein
MANQTERPKATVLQVFLALFAGLVPYVVGALVVNIDPTDRLGCTWGRSDMHHLDFSRIRDAKIY